MGKKAKAMHLYRINITSTAPKQKNIVPIIEVGEGETQESNSEDLSSFLVSATEALNRSLTVLANVINCQQ